MTESVLTIDPGEVTGWSYWALDPEYPIQRLEYGLIHGGLDGFITWMEIRLGRLRPDILICEKWNPNDGRVYGDPTEPLRIEGAIAAMVSALGIGDVEWQFNSMKALCTDDKLREHGLYIMPSHAKVDPAIMHKDARDVNDTFSHTLAFAKASGHQPTIDLYWPDM